LIETLNFVWLDVVDWKQLITCSFLAPFSPFCGVWLDLGLEYLQMIQMCYKIILCSLFILLEDCELTILSCNLFPYVVFRLCGGRTLLFVWASTKSFCFFCVWLCVDRKLLKFFMTHLILLVKFFWKIPLNKKIK